MSRLMKWIDAWIFREYAPLSRGLPLYRIVFALWLIFLTLPESSAVSGLPNSFFTPTVGPALLFHGFPPPWFFGGLDYLVELAAFCLLFGYRTRIASFSLFLLLAIGGVFRYSAGKIDHDILIIAVCFCLGWSDWGRRYSFDANRAAPPRTPSAWPQALLMMMIGLCMLSAALPKSHSGWLDPHMEPCRGQLLLNYIGAERPTRLADAMLKISSSVFWKFLDYSTVLLEGSFIFAMFRLPAMRIAAASACIFHGSIYYSMAIFFSANLAAYLCLVDFRIFLRYRVVRWALARFDRLARRVRLVPLALIVAVFDAGYVMAGSPRWMASEPLQTVVATITLGAGLISLAYLFTQGLKRILA